MINIYEYLLSKFNKNTNTNYEIFPSKKFSDAVEAAEVIYNEMKDVLPKLNDGWQKYLNDKDVYSEPFSNAKEYDEYYKDCKENTLKDYKGFLSRIYDTWESGIFDRYASCLHSNKNDTIKSFNSKKIDNNRFSILYSTCCVILERYGRGDPMEEWTVKDFRMADLGMQIAFRIIIYEKQ